MLAKMEPELAEKLAADGTAFNFIPPSAPCMVEHGDVKLNWSRLRSLHRAEGSQSFRVSTSDSVC